MESILLSNSIPQEAFQDIIDELRRRPITVNKYRNQTGEGRSQAFGLVNRRSLPIDYSRQSWLRPKLLFHLQEFAKNYVPIPWTSITVNQNYQTAPHYDKGNMGDSFLVGFGSYAGGDLIIHEGDLSGNHSIYCKPIIADFSKIKHSTAVFSGERYSLVFYVLKPTKMPLEPLPKGEAVLEDGKYVFKRGNQIITPKCGLPHPLRNRKKEPTAITKTSGDFEVTFQ